MSEKEEPFVILYDCNCSKLFLHGRFLSAYNKFREQIVKALFMKSYYDKLEDAELHKERTLEVVMTNCPGGSIADTFALIGLLREFERKLPNVTFTLYCCGSIQSAATIFMTCEVFAKVSLDRYCSVKIHNVETSFEKAPSLKKRCFEVYQKESELTESIMCAHYEKFAALREKPGQDWQKFIDMGNEETWWSAEKVLEHGLCDEVL